MQRRKGVTMELATIIVGAPVTIVWVAVIIGCIADGGWSGKDKEAQDMLYVLTAPIWVLLLSLIYAVVS